MQFNSEINYLMRIEYNMRQLLFTYKIVNSSKEERKKLIKETNHEVLMPLWYKKEIIKKEPTIKPEQLKEILGRKRKPGIIQE